MTYDMYRTIYIVFAIAANLMLALASILYFKLKIPKTIGGLTGSVRRKAVKQKEGQGIGTDMSGPVKAGEAVTTAKITTSGSLVPRTDLPNEPQPPRKATTVLTEQTARGANGFEVEFDITFVQTDEIID